MSIYESDPNAAPDSAFEPGRPDHLVVGNTGRLLDPRRTPVTVVGLRPEAGFFVIRIDGFEDRAAVWEVPFEKVDRYQFARGSRCAGVDDVTAFRAAIERLDRPLEIPGDADARRATDETLRGDEQAAAAWLERNSAFVAAGRSLPDPAGRVGDPLLYRDLEAHLAEHDLDGMERAFAARFVSNPDSGDMIKGHRIVIAEMGLAPYAGTIARDPGLFDGGWSRQRRARHVRLRLAFVRALFRRLGRGRVSLYRGISTDGPLTPPRNDTFVSASFSLDVARSHFDIGGDESTAVLVRQPVPVDRVFMTYYETATMNEQFREAEAVLLHEPGNGAF